MMSADATLRDRPSLGNTGSEPAAPEPPHYARPSEQRAYLKQELANLEAYCSTLKGALAAAGIATVPARRPILEKLRRQEAALVGILFAAYPRVVHAYDILQALPGRDHAEEDAADEPDGDGDDHPVRPLEVELLHDHGEAADEGRGEHALEDQGDEAPEEGEALLLVAAVAIEIDVAAGLQRAHPGAARDAAPARRDRGVVRAARRADDGAVILRGHRG